jgi:hypothetical protein
VADRPQPLERAPLARDQAAAAVGSKGRNVVKAKRINEQEPELAEQVKDGSLNLDAAHKEAAKRQKVIAGQQYHRRSPTHGADLPQVSERGPRARDQAAAMVGHQRSSN